nr:type II toxin-antitoxin system RelE/ParE family toxin [uncultured Albidiferax sp.]
MKPWLAVVRSDQYLLDLMAMHDTIAQDNTDAAMDMFLDIDNQVAHLADPNFPRRKGRKPGTLELVVHPNYIVVLEQNASSVIALALLHVAKQYP